MCLETRPWHFVRGPEDFSWCTGGLCKGYRARAVALNHTRGCFVSSHVGRLKDIRMSPLRCNNGIATSIRTRNNSSSISSFAPLMETLSRRYSLITQPAQHIRMVVTHHRHVQKLLGQRLLFEAEECAVCFFVVRCCA